MTRDSDSTRISADGSNVTTGPDSTNAKRSLRSWFVGPNGIRAGWRLLMFLAFFIVIIGAFLFAIHHIPALHAWRSARPENELSAGWVMFADGFEFAAVFVAAFLMSQIEKRTFADYYLPLNQAFECAFGRVLHTASRWYRC